MLVTPCLMARRGDIQLSASALKLRRESLFLSQAELASAAKMGLSNVQRLERGEISSLMRTNVPDLSAALRYSEAEFMDKIAVRTLGPAAEKRYVRRDQSGAFVSKTSPPDKRILHDTESAKFAGGRDDYSRTLPAGNDPKPQRDRPAERQPHAGTGIPTIDAVSLDSDASAALRDAAAKYGTTPSDLVRHLLGLPPRTKPLKRPKTKARAR